MVPLPNGAAKTLAEPPPDQRHPSLEGTEEPGHREDLRKREALGRDASRGRDRSGIGGQSNGKPEQRRERHGSVL